MASQRIHAFPVFVILLALLLPPPCRAAAAPDIVLPDPLAVELPEGVDSLGADDPPIKALIAAAHADAADQGISIAGTGAAGTGVAGTPVAGTGVAGTGVVRTPVAGTRITAALPRDRLGVGVWRVIWSAWDGDASDHPVAPDHPVAGDHPLARREAFLYVVPHGMTPVGVSGKSNAGAGNNATHIARDGGGYVHMVWTDSWRPGAHDDAVYRRAQMLPDGTLRFDGETRDLGDHPSSWTAMPALALVGDTVHFVWQDGGTAHYRSLTRDGAAWRWSAEVDTKAPSYGRDTGPSIAADANAVHILTPAGSYTTSRDGGRTWTTEAVPFGSDQHVKTASLTLDAEGRALAASSSVVSGPENLSDEHGSGGYWTIRLERRIVPGVWEAIPGPLDGRPEWAAPAQPNQDVLADWVRVLEDQKGGIHVTWHGTAVSRIYANDRAYYAWRSPDGTWRTPVALREPDPGRGIGWSYAPALTLDGDRALALLFYDMHAGHQDRGFDSELRLFEAGQPVAAAFPVTGFAARSIATGEPTTALSAWFPGTAPSLFRAADGRIWADVLVTLVPNGVPAPALIVWQRLDLTDWLKAADQ